jgi:hypothetical protein
MHDSPAMGESIAEGGYYIADRRRFEIEYRRAVPRRAIPEAL